MATQKVEFIDVLVGENYPIRETTMDGRRYLVVPVIPLVEGVHNGILHTPQEMARFVAAWNGVPIIVDHAYDQEGIPISANTPEIISKQGVGNVFGTSFDADNNRLMAQAWIDIEKISRVSPSALSTIKARRHMEISIGTFGEYDGLSGEWHGEAYTTVIRAYRPDHLALLPGGEGACSWQDGCGVRVNKKGATVMAGVDLNELQTYMRNLGVFKATSLAAERVENLATGEMSHGDIAGKLRGQLDAMDSESMMYFLEEVYEDYLIYKVRGRDMGTGATIDKTFKREYSIDAAGAVTLAEGTQEVMEKTEYVPVTAASAATVPVVAMQTKEVRVSDDQKARVDALIACKCTQFEEDDRTWLSALSAEQLDKLKAQEPVIVPAPRVPATLAEYIDGAPEAFRAVLRDAVTAHEAHKDIAVKAVLANTRNKFTEVELRAMEMNAIENLTVLGNVPVDYSGQGGSPKVESPTVFKNDAPLVFPMKPEVKPAK